MLVLEVRNPTKGKGGETSWRQVVRWPTKGEGGETPWRQEVRWPTKGEGGESSWRQNGNLKLKFCYFAKWGYRGWIEWSWYIAKPPMSSSICVQMCTPEDLRSDLNMKRRLLEHYLQSFKMLGKVARAATKVVGGQHKPRATTKPIERGEHEHDV